MTAFKQWVLYCITIRENPLRLPCDTELATFFLADRVHHTGSIGSIKNWSAMLNWIHELAGVKKNYKKSENFKNFKIALAIEYPNKSDPRLPFKIEHILQFTKHHNVNLLTLDITPINTLLKVLLVQAYFFTMSRPCELILSLYSDTKKGIKIGCLKRDRNNNPSYFAGLIIDHKTINKKRDPKYVYLTDTRCNKILQGSTQNCMCFYLNPYRILCAYLKRRFRSKSLRIKLDKFSKYKNVFVWEDGNIVTTTDLSNITKELVKIINIPIRDQHRYSSYSYRIGGTTRGVAVGINHTNILKFVGWSDSFLGDSSITYIRPSTETLVLIPFQMIHGIGNQITQQTHEYMNQGLVFDPWSKTAMRSRNKY